MNVLIACEESQRVCAAFRERGHNAFSCDLQYPSGGFLGWHIKGDVLDILTAPACFYTVDGSLHKIDKWDMIIAHPPCTVLSFAGNRALRDDVSGERHRKLNEASAFFMEFVKASEKCPRVCIENPLGWMSNLYRKPDQIIHPYYFASPYDAENYVKKRTCLWLFGLPKLIYTPHAREPKSKWCETRVHHSDADRAKERSKTFTVIAEAMANQWG